MSQLRHRILSPLYQEPETATSLAPHVETLPEPVSGAVPDQSRAQVTVISGAHLESFPLAGMPVAQARALIGQLMSIHADAPMIVNGSPVESGYELQAGDTLEFVHHAGEKGWCSWTGA